MWVVYVGMPESEQNRQINNNNKNRGWDGANIVPRK
jgi:hypothetical protein